jgi:hypothetical protein
LGSLFWSQFADEEQSLLQPGLVYDDLLSGAKDDELRRPGDEPARLIRACGLGPAWPWRGCGPGPGRGRRG